MQTVRGTRRAFVGGAVAGAAILGSAALLRRADTGSSELPIPGKTRSAARGPLVAVSPEIAKWAAAVGEPVRIAGEFGMAAGVVDIVLNAANQGERPAGLRQHPFLVYFEMDRAGAPKGDRIYSIQSTIEGLSEVFLTRGEDRGGKAILIALFG